ncbi:MAG: LytTR family DNA-binding domain-containing protein [Lachnospiraceae bacterium]|nr:LytTR family DNA-binding domain-containing protein [Lachnospiraceae bacterium]
MHIAICDDNIADRKQLERLLNREADRRVKEGISLYIDSFGNIASLMHAPALYDVFYIDMTASDDENGIDLASLLRSHNIESPVVLCSSKIPYKEYHCTLNNLIYLDKPIRAEELSDTVSMVIRLKQQSQPTFEIRTRKKTIYIESEDFLYAKQINNRQALVYLQDGTVCDLPDSIDNLELIMKKHPSLIRMAKHYLVNSSTIQKITLTSMLLSNGAKIPLGFGEYRELKKILKL